MSAYARDVERFHSEVYGGIGSQAQWDRAEELALGARRMTAREAPRKDAALFEARIALVAPRMPKRELDCAFRYWRGSGTTTAIAKAMGVAVTTVREWIARTRKRIGALD